MKTAIATIRAGEFLSNHISLEPLILRGIFVPQEWTDADIAIEATIDNGKNFFPLLAADGAEILFKARRGCIFISELGILRCTHNFLLKSRTVGAPVKQKDTVTLTLICEHP